MAGEIDDLTLLRLGHNRLRRENFPRFTVLHHAGELPLDEGGLSGFLMDMQLYVELIELGRGLLPK
jgi:hypothetical protein